MTSGPALILCHFTAVEIAPPQFVELAHRTGYTSVSLMVEFPAGFGRDYPMVGDTMMRRETKQRLDDTGLTLFDASVCRLDAQTRVADFAPMLESSAYLGAGSINVVGSDDDPARLRDNFARVCALAGDFGLEIGLEFMMSSQVQTLSAALELIASSGAGNATVTLDALHLARSGGTVAAVAALDDAQISYVQLCDGPAELPPQGYSYEGATERLMPGDGALPVGELVAAVGTGVPLAIEVPSATRIARGISADEHAARGRRVLDSLLLLR